MLDNKRDKEIQRNQLIGILLMTVLVVAWSYFFLPSTPPKPAKSETATMSTEGEIPPLSLLSQNVDAVPDAIHQESLLPPVAEVPQDPKEDEFQLSNPDLELVFTRVGARLKRATVKLGRENADSIQLIPQNLLATDAEVEYPLGLLFSDPLLGEALNYRRWEIVEATAQRLVFQIEAPGYARLRKTFLLTESGHRLETRVAYTNLGTEKRLLGLDRKEPAFSLYWAPNVTSQDLQKGSGQSIVWRKADSNTYHATSKLKLPGSGWYSDRILDTEWGAVCSAYFAVAIKPEFEFSDVWFYGTPAFFRMGVGVPRSEVNAGETLEFAFQAYVGPRGKQALSAAWPGLETLLSFFTTFTFMDQFAKLLLTILVWFHDHVIANYGLAIIFLTILVRLVMFPLTWKSMLSMKRMSMLAPEMEKIKQECKDDQQEMQKRMMEMYRERGVSPLGGCLPMLLQMPVFIALYRMLWSAFELRRAPFLFWINDLSEPDRLFTLPFSIPIPLSAQPLESLNLLPVLMALAMVVSQKLMPMSGPAQTPQQKTLMTIMPVFFSVITYNMASGLNLYILVSTLLGIAQNYFVRGIHVDVEPVKRKKPAKPRHFYDVVRSKQREMNRELRKQKQRNRRRKNSNEKE